MLINSRESGVVTANVHHNKKNPAMITKKPSCLVFLMLCFLVLSDNNFLVVVESKNLDHLQEDRTCENVKHFFHTLNVTLSEPHFDKTGPTCSGHCCDNKTEDDLMFKSAHNFENLLRHHTRSLRGTLESTANRFREHVLQLSRQSENKTLNLFSQVYRRMSPLSRQHILELYDSIRSHISSKDHTEDLEKVVNRFFINLFPVAYHHAVHTGSDSLKGDFHSDYKNCLEHTYHDLQPFGEIPKQIVKSLVQSLGPATVFLRSLDKAALVLSSTEELDSEYLSVKCKTHLLKMSYCPECRGISREKIKTCSSYCLNVMRGCLTQYVGSLDGPWSSFAVSIERLMNFVRSKDGIESVVKTLDAKLSEAIMHAMENGPTLEKKVKRSCGTPTLLPTDKINIDENQIQPAISSKWISPPDTEMLFFLVTIDKSKDLYLKIVDSLCDDEEYRKDDRNCWTGSHIGEYTHPLLATSISVQKYNPEVPYEPSNTLRVTKLTELSDKFVELQRQVANAYSHHTEITESMQADMAEGSTWDNDDIDDYGGSGGGSGEKIHNPQVVDVSSIDRTNSGNNISPNNHPPGGSLGHRTRISLETLLLPLILAHVVILLITRRL